MKPLALVVTCGCGERGRILPGETWRCDACGRAYTTEGVEEDYAAFVRRVNRAKLMSFSGLAVMAAIFVPLGVIFGAQLWLTGAILLAVYYFWYGPVHKRAVRRLVRERPQWTVRELGDD